MTTGEVIALIKALSGGGGSGGGGVLVVTDTDGTLDKTWQEIHDAFVAGSVRIQKQSGKSTALMNVKTVGAARDGYGIMCDNYTTNQSYSTDSADGYPTLE